MTSDPSHVSKQANLTLCEINRSRTKLYADIVDLLLPFQAHGLGECIDSQHQAFRNSHESTNRSARVLTNRNGVYDVGARTVINVFRQINVKLSENSQITA